MEDVEIGTPTAPKDTVVSFCQLRESVPGVWTKGLHSVLAHGVPLVLAPMARSISVMAVNLTGNERLSREARALAAAVDKGRVGQCSGMTPEDVRLVVAGGDEFSVVCRSLPHRDP
jgi:hypothetical protein